MARITDLSIKKQTASDLYYASWKFEHKVADTSTADVKAGDWVTINEGAKYYTGQTVPDWVMERTWKVIAVRYDSVVLGEDKEGEHNIVSAFKISDVTPTTGGTATTKDASDTVDHYETEWLYHTGDGNWFEGSSGTTEKTNSTYTPPSNAIKIRIRIKPVSKTYKDGDEDKTYWTGEWVYEDYKISVAQPPEDIGAPDVEIEDFTLTATLDNISDPRAEKVQFQVYDGDTLVKTGKVNVTACRAIYTCTITAGGQYRVRCRAIFMHGSTEVYSDWSDFSGEQTTVPTYVTRVTARADTPTSFKVSWNASDNADSYEIEYSVKKEYFDSSNQVSSMSVTTTSAVVTGVEGGEWFVRVRAVNEAGEGEWSSIISVIIGTLPEAPTTWSLTSTAVVGEDIIFYWVHNCEDGSRQVSAELQLNINGSTRTITVDTPSSDSTYENEEENPVYQYVLPTTGYTAGATILWKVRTKGVVNQYGEWSTQRTVTLYAKPTLYMSLDITDGTLTSLPLKVNASAGPTSQTPISYHVSITADQTYETVDNIGNPTVVTAGTMIYSKIFDFSLYDITVLISAGDLRIENGQSYTATVTVAMDSGLTASDSTQFTTDWSDPVIFVDASIAIDHETLAAYICPFCVNADGERDANMSLSVYRREFNGGFTLIASGLSNERLTTVTDPHPALDYARYRIVAQDSITGTVEYEDLPGQPVKEHAIVIQWDEQWYDYNYVESAEPEVKPWVGSMIKLPYNIDITESYNPDVSLIEYIGRKHPVSYYGTQRGETATWSTDIDKSNKELIYALRRLAAWNGDVYVREPSGTGYWAHITVSMPIKHLELVIPVTFTISRVEGSDI